MENSLRELSARPRVLQSQMADYIHHYANKVPDREALVFGEQRITYKTLDEQIAACARALVALGVNKGDRVAMLANPSPEFLVVYLAATSIGAIWMGINPKYQLDECRYVVGDAQPKVLFSIAGFAGRDVGAMVETLQAEFPCIASVIALEEGLSGVQSFAAFMAMGDDASLESRRQGMKARVDRMDPALLVYTSGSSGKPKGALLSHYGLCYGAVVQNQHFKVEQPRIICNFPINHVACVADTCGVGLVAGGTLYLQERFDPQTMLEAISREKINVLGAMPTMLLMLLDHPEAAQTDFSSLELILWGGAAMPEATIKRLNTLAPRLMTVYGATETSFNVTFSAEGASLEELRDSIGRPSPGVQCRIVNGMGAACEPYEQGELQFKGDWLFLGYYNRPDATCGAFTDTGWYHTGDVGFWREDGNITLVGRLSEMFKSGGYNVYPREVELLLESHPQVEMAAIVAVPDPLYQEVGAAFVIPAQSGGPGSTGEGVLTAEALKAFCRKHLANYKVPKSFALSAELPMLPNGKVDKRALGELWASPRRQDRKGMI